MALYNLMEEIVVNIVEEIVQKEGSPDINRDDIVAYVLNRIAPQYVTSERGILHGRIATKYKIQQKADILIYIYEAIEVIKKRRDSSPNAENASLSPVFYVVKHIVGELAEAESLSPLPGVKASLLYNGEPAKMVDAGWVNPYTTNMATKGYYHFWPIYDEVTMKDKKKTTFQLKFEHPDYETVEQDIEIGIDSNQSVKQTHFIPMILLTAKK